jgi:hypothetical protein
MGRDDDGIIECLFGLQFVNVVCLPGIMVVHLSVNE